MGILRRLLKKKEKPDGKKRLNKGADPLQSGDSEVSPTPVPEEPVPITDLVEASQLVPQTIAQPQPEETEPKVDVVVSEPQPERIQQEAREETISPVGLREGVHIAEQSLTRVGLALATLGQSLPGEEASIARIKIILMEAKIPLAEAGIRVAETEIDPLTTRQKLSEAEERLSAVELRIIDAERAVASIAENAQGASSSLADVKIGLATAKIRVSQARIQLTGAMFPKSPDEGKAPQFPETSPRPIRLPQEEPVRAFQPPLTLRGTEHGEDPFLSPSPVRIADEPQSRGDSARRDRSFEPVKFHSEEKSKTSENEMKTRVIMGGLDEEESPFDTGISARVHISDEGEAPAPPVPTTKEPMKIRSDERESAWVSADGTLKDKIMEREEESSQVRDEERSRIAISQPAPQKDIIIEELNRKGIELRRTGKLVDAIECFNQVLALDPGNVAALHNRGVALRAEGHFEEALASFERVIERESTNPLVWFNKAFVLSKLQRHEEAIRSFDRVLALEPSNAAAWYNKGKLLALMGRTAEADQHLEKARELGYIKGAPQTQ